MHTISITSELRRTTSALTMRQKDPIGNSLNLLKLIQKSVPLVTSISHSEHCQHGSTMKHNLATSTRLLLSRSGGSVKAGITQPFWSPEVFVFCSPIQNTWELSLQQALELNTIIKQSFTRRIAYTLWRITQLHYIHGIFEKKKKKITKLLYNIQKSMDS